MECKKIFLFLIFLILAFSIFSGCIQVEEDDNLIEGDDVDDSFDGKSVLSVFDKNWSSMWVDSSNCNSATDIKMDIGPNDQPQVISGMHESSSYCDLRYYYYDTDWRMEIIPFESDFMGEEADIVVDSNNNPHVIFVDETKNKVYYAVKYTNWSFDLIEAPPSYVLNMGITLDSNKDPHVIYDTCGVGDDYSFPEGGKPKAGERTFRYARKQGNEWVVDVISNHEYVGSGKSVAIDSNDNPHTAFYENESLFYAYKNVTWRVEKIDDMMEGNDAYIDVDSNDIPHILYKDRDRQLIHASYDSDWDFEILDKSSGPQQGVRLVIDEDDVIHVFYSFCDEANTEGNNLYVNYMYKKNGVWKKEEVCYGGEGDIAIDSNGKPHICFGLCRPNTDIECELIRYAYKK